MCVSIYVCVCVCVEEKCVLCDREEKRGSERFIESGDVDESNR